MYIYIITYLEWRFINMLSIHSKVVFYVISLSPRRTQANIGDNLEY
jgi:hypothetical protein